MTYVVGLDVGDEIDEPCNLRHAVIWADATALTFTPSRPAEWCADDDRSFELPLALGTQASATPAAKNSQPAFGAVAGLSSQ
jgi:hypothetical protein